MRAARVRGRSGGTAQCRPPTSNTADILPSITSEETEIKREEVTRFTWQSGKGTARSPEHATARRITWRGQPLVGAVPGAPVSGAGRRHRLVPCLPVSWAQDGHSQRCPAPATALLNTSGPRGAWHPVPKAPPPRLPPDLDPGQKVQEQGWGGAGHHLPWTLAPNRAVLFNLGEQRVRGHQTAPCTQQTPGPMTPTAAHRRRQGLWQGHCGDAPRDAGTVRVGKGPGKALIPGAACGGSFRPGHSRGRQARRGPEQRGHLWVPARPTPSPTSSQG